MKPRVLHVGPLPPPMGGVAAALEAILRCRHLQGWDHRVFNVSDGQPTETVGRKRFTLGRAARRLKRAARLARVVLHQRPELVHFQQGSETALDIIGDLVAMWVSSTGGSRVVLHLHVDPAAADLPGRKWFGQWLFRQFIRPAHAIFTLTEGYRCHLLSCSVRQPVRVVPNMCDETFLALTERRSRTPGLVRALFVGRLTRAKGFFDLLHVAARLRRGYPRIQFEVAGLPSTADERYLIREIIERESLHETVNLLGVVTGTGKLRLFGRADLLVAPSYGESFGIVALEAMAAGLPVLATKVGGMASTVVHGETGFLFEPGDRETLTEQLQRLAADEALRLRFGRAGRERFLAHYSAQRVGPIIAETYQQILAGA